MESRPDQVELESLVLYAMKEKPGIIAKGKSNVPCQEVLEELEKAIYKHYEMRGESFIAPPLEVLQDYEGRGVSCSVTKHTSVAKDDGSVAEQKSISIAYYGTEKKSRPLVKKADFPVSWSTSSNEKFGVYFNLKTPEQSRIERDDFLEQTRRLSRMH